MGWREYIFDILVPTSVHIPAELLEEVDRRARRLKISRNRFIVRALEKEIAGEAAWSPGFFEQLGRVTADEAEAVGEMARAIRAGRASKGPPRF